MLACGGLLMQFMVQGAWGVVPAYLNEMSPGPVRAIVPGLTYQLGNLIASWNSHVQESAASRFYGGGGGAGGGGGGGVVGRVGGGGRSAITSSPGSAPSC